MAIMTCVDHADVAVVGAGPAGLMAAIAAAERGRKVILIEQLPRPGRKLLATGGGRCNLTNTLPAAELAARFGRHGRFMMPALDLLSPSGLRSFFDGLAVPTCVPDGFHVYPASDSAATVLAAIDGRARRLGVIFRLGVRATGLWLSDQELLRGGSPHPPRRPAQSLGAVGAETHRATIQVENALRGDKAQAPAPRLLGLLTDGGPVAAPCVVLATGGRGYPDLGATGTGYALARQAGHTIVDPVPALVPLVIRETEFRQCAGVSLPVRSASGRTDAATRRPAPARRANAGARPAGPGGDAALYGDAATSPAVRVWIDLPRHPRAGVTGDLLFTHRGVSGPAILDISGDVAALLASRPTVPIRIDLAPGITAAAWLDRFDRRQAGRSAATVRALLADHLPKSLAAAIAEFAGVDPAARPSEVPRPARQRLATVLTGLPLTATATEGWDAAMITRGGVSLKEVDPHTLRSRRLAGLFFAGEILDLDGPSGGFNLQWAFSSGRLAGTASAECDVRSAKSELRP